MSDLRTKDLIERLHGLGAEYSIGHEAADEIERLKAALQAKTALVQVGIEELTRVSNQLVKCRNALVPFAELGRTIAGIYHEGELWSTNDAGILADKFFAATAALTDEEGTAS